ncbi:D-Ala-D-Ala carboxypeptidase family metallohydrolase [Oceanibaculum sp.]|uniref:D-Ala-D-Ala carboxypeptidase family metallohydrolase n=1 Tax=Oceanibaculum sp. TaxID=1903597 RepID=UPI0025907810|nr:D-Ala-D-Ala carboxypeptidase family metallohydrolase [Oceanibaculum sp.]MCH2394426.1 D-Ala-D-Ala carboxypeptidase family metallohydrolase [Oceanibaculum sp.]
MSLFFRHWSLVPNALWRWPDFTPREIASRGDGSLLIAPTALDRLQALRNALRRPVIVTSAYRDPVHNARVGGAPLSRHKAGDAFDLALRGQNRAEMLDAARAAGFTGFGFYSTFLHVDCGPAREWGDKRWTS